MTGRRRPPFFGFVVLATMVALLVALVGGRLIDGSEAAVRAWRWGCGVSLAASIVAGLVVLAGSTSAQRGVAVGLGSMLARLVALALMAVAAGTLLALEPRPFLLAIAVSYVLLLIVDTGYAVVVLGRL